MTDRDLLAALQAENARLIALLEARGIEWRLPPQSMSLPKTVEFSSLSTDEKVTLFRKLFTAVPTSIRCDGRARPLASRSTGNDRWYGETVYRRDSVRRTGRGLFRPIAASEAFIQQD